MLKHLLAAFLIFCSSAWAGTLPPDLVQAARAYDRAQFRNDAVTLSHLVSDDFILVNSNATIENKAQFLADFHLPGFRIEPYVWQQPVRNVWRDGAVWGGVIHLKWTQNGRQHSRVLRIAYVWRKQDGRWRAVYAQLTRAP